jgi:hypothetical protein
VRRPGNKDNPSRGFNQTKHARWNGKGPEFMQLLELFDDVAEHVEEGCDPLAERAAAKLSKAAHFQGPLVPVTVRFSEGAPFLANRTPGPLSYSSARILGL